MNYHMSATLGFAAGHQVDDEWCGPHQHGHLFEVTCTWGREGFASTDLELWTVYRGKMLDLVQELKDRDLNKMLGAQVPNVFGVAAFFVERLAILTPLVVVEVKLDDTYHGPVARIERGQND